jgi:hypothetical protein
MMATLETALLRALDPVAWARDAFGFEPDDWQAGVLRSNSPRLLINGCRQGGKSTTTALLALHTAIYQPGALVLVLSPSLRQSGEWFRRLTTFLDRLPAHPALLEDNRLSLELEGGSRVVSLPSSEDTIRGFSGAALIIEDESARVPDDVHQAVRAMTATSLGRQVLLSSPWGRRGHFYELWEHGGPDFERVLVPWQRCPRLDAAFVEAERRALPPHVFASEWLCQFSEIEGGVFAAEDIHAMFDNSVEPLFPERVGAVEESYALIA